MLDWTWTQQVPYEDHGHQSKCSSTHSSIYSVKRNKAVAEAIAVWKVLAEKNSNSGKKENGTNCNHRNVNNERSLWRMRPVLTACLCLCRDKKRSQHQEQVNGKFSMTCIEGLCFFCPFWFVNEPVLWRACKKLRWKMKQQLHHKPWVNNFINFLWKLWFCNTYAIVRDTFSNAMTLTNPNSDQYINVMQLNTQYHAKSNKSKKKKTILYIYLLL